MQYVLSVLTHTINASLAVYINSTTMYGASGGCDFSPCMIINSDLSHHAAMHFLMLVSVWSRVKHLHLTKTKTNISLETYNIEAKRSYWLGWVGLGWVRLV